MTRIPPVAEYFSTVYRIGLYSDAVLGKGRSALRAEPTKGLTRNLLFIKIITDKNKSMNK